MQTAPITNHGYGDCSGEFFSNPQEHFGEVAVIVLLSNEQTRCKTSAPRKSPAAPLPGFFFFPITIRKALEIPSANQADAITRSAQKSRSDANSP